ncbi:MAG: SAM-dependent methyltransferase [Clostridia bacterium]|nr:SAM-dependent methyltransferase [Clostridia bacterium]
MLVLRPRLQAALEMLGACKVAADIGCDHGRLSAAMLQRGTAECVISIDVSADSLKKAEVLARKLGLEQRMQTRLGDGLQPLAVGEADGIVLAGMGGTLIARLLQANEPVARAARCIVMQPMRGGEDLREYLYHNGYDIFDERLVLDAGRIYQLIAARSGEAKSKPEGWPENLYKVGWVSYEKREPLLSQLVNTYLAANEKRLKTAPEDALELRRNTEDLRKLIRMMEEA